MISLIKSQQLPLSWSHWSNHTNCLSLRSFQWQHDAEFFFLKNQNMNTIWSHTSNHKTIPHPIYYNLNGWNRDLTTPIHCLKNPRNLLQEIKNQRTSSRTPKILLQPFNSKSKNLLNCFSPRKFVAPWWTSTHKSRTPAPHQIISLIRKIFKKIHSSRKFFRTLSLSKNSLTFLAQVLASKNLLK